MRNIQISLFVMFAGTLSASAQLISIGIKGGIPVTDSFTGRDESRRYQVGASVEFRLPAGFAVEADLIYQPIGLSSAFAGYLQGAPENPVTTSFVRRLRGNSYEFPLLGKYYFRRGESAWQPFIASGYAFRTIKYSDDYRQTSTDSSGLVSTSPEHSSYGSGLGVGAVFGAGIRLRTGRFAFVPEFRYTRWGQFENNAVHKDEAGVLLGITF
jgi:hypothetical protein